MEKLRLRNRKWLEQNPRAARVRITAGLRSVDSAFSALLQKTYRAHGERRAAPNPAEFITCDWKLSVWRWIGWRLISNTVSAWNFKRIRWNCNQRKKPENLSEGLWLTIIISRLCLFFEKQTWKRWYRIDVIWIMSKFCGEKERTWRPKLWKSFP